MMMENSRTCLLLKLGVAFAAPLAGFIFSYFHFPIDETEETRRKARISSVPVGCGRGLKLGLFILQNEEVPTINVVHGASIKLANNISLQSLRSFGREVVKQQFAEQEQKEIFYLRNLVQSLWDKNRSLEREMLGCDRLKDQETIVRELEKQLKLKSMEAKCSNQKLKLAASGRYAIERQLESAKLEIEQLRRRLGSVNEQAKVKAASLEQRSKTVDVGFETMMRLKELEDEAAKARKEKSTLEQKSLELEERLVSISALEEETNQLKQVKEDLEKKIEQIHSDHCADVEELVHLRWINACLRYELRGRQEKTKAKPRIEWLHLRNGNINEAECSSSPESNYEYEEEAPCDDDSSSFVVKKTTSSSRTSKFLGRIKKLVLRKGVDRRNKLAAAVNRQKCARESDDETGRSSVDSIDSCFTEERSPNGDHSIIYSHFGETEATN
ncbi:protein CHUP1, chloroplastic-like isoform X2 [Canna indica]|uniref:Protein CHUP1, chloroplastic-like isoform X2 n=1 Tax=Canna indica TaxID=4628 RepID=A0AAQ3QTB3_9LILI|nr:protein CHUP1, chloroplastic-like isoform X2 [Canna indica]